MLLKADVDNCLLSEVWAQVRSVSSRSCLFFQILLPYMFYFMFYFSFRVAVPTVEVLFLSYMGDAPLLKLTSVSTFFLREGGPT